jgi:hypothetical protein
LTIFTKLNPQNAEADVLAWITNNVEKARNFIHTDGEILSSRAFVRIDSRATYYATGILSTSSRILPEEAIDLPSDLVLNLEEVGIPDGENHKPTRVVGPSMFANQTIHDGISQNSKQILIIAWAFADKTSLTQSVGISSAILPVPLYLEQVDVQIEKYLILQRPQKPYIESKLFRDLAASDFARLERERGVIQGESRVVMPIEEP